MSPTIPISRFVDPEPEERSVAAEPTVHPADAPAGVMRMTPEEQHAQVCKQLGRDSLPLLNPKNAWRDALDAYSSEMLTSKHRGVLERRAEAERRAMEAARAATESRPTKDYRPRTAWAKRFKRLATYPYPPEFGAFTCGARTRAGTPCKLKTLYRSGRCKLHGGLSTGPRTEQGRRQSALNGRKGGRPRKRIVGQET
jgi:hypothetical protein